MNGTKVVTCPASHHRIENIHNGKVANGTVKAGGQDKPAPGKYIRWDVEEFNRFQMMNFNEHMHCLRGTHLKTQSCIMGKCPIGIVHDNLPTHLAQGMFAKPGAYDVIMRYSSLTPKLVPDNVPAPRVISMKIFGVEGEKIWGEDKKTQDWICNNYPILELRDPQTTYDIANSLERNWNDLPTFAHEQSKRADADVVTLGMVAMPEYSQSVYRYGDYVAKFSVFPLNEAQKRLVDTEIKDSDPINMISQELRSFRMKNKVTYSFCAQLLQDLTEQPDSWLPEFRVWSDDRITVNSWHGLKAHQPLGSTNRMRRVVYAESRKLRLRVNGHRDYVEPTGLNEVPVPVPAPQLLLRHQNALQTTEVA
ncbi:hypothetical protein BU23DRAFT_584926 [Bimuria novae-zelandiae CBS 107.79]|uniref:Heme-dependent catalase n=1 Tax=Bimuria novae-zelandiae CBS 107.79 TaxID=1447943 RepID=A0A6A5URY9_9PLEO|nr:hypothetical protein BU23DRAFT_584926 [Bimuria novae-zelandiae CBS 107.79]